MKLKVMEIKNFRSIKHDVVNFVGYTCFVGENGSGKSTVLQALNIFFRNTREASLDLLKLSEEDFHKKNIAEPIEITLTFDELTPEESVDFKAYVRSNKLIVTSVAEWKSESRYAEVKQVGSRLEIKEFQQCYDENLRAEELKKIYSELRLKYTELLAKTSKSDIIKSLREYEESNPDKCEECRSENQFYGWSKGENKLKKYINWVYVPAVKDAATEQNGEKSNVLTELISRTVKSKVNFEEKVTSIQRALETEYQKMVDDNSGALEGVRDSLAGKLKDWAHDSTTLDIRWGFDNKSFVIKEPFPTIRIGEHDFLGEIARSGHGLQRSLLIALLQELVSSDDSTQPLLILGIEEPELYQHPPQARYMATILQKLIEKNTQVLLTTHSPYFISAKNMEDIRVVAKKMDVNKITQFSYEKLAEMLSVALGEKAKMPSSLLANAEQIMLPSINELFFSRFPIFVEGIEDVAYLSTYILHKGLEADFRKYGCHFIVAGGKTNISRPLAICKIFGMNAFSIFDGDQNCKPDDKGKHERDNKCIMVLSGTPTDKINSMPETTIVSDQYAVVFNNIGFSVKADMGQDYDVTMKEAREDYGYIDGIGEKNIMLISALLETYLKKNKNIPILDNIIEKILERAKIGGNVVKI